MKDNPLLNRLRHHVTGAIERGEGEAIVEERETTDVIFRRWPKKQGGKVIALFPLLPETPIGTCTSYEHVGQHGSASLYLSMDTLPAKEGEPDVDALKRELESIGYRLRVIQRLPNWRKIDKARQTAGL